MTNFCSIKDVEDPAGWIKEAIELKEKIEKDGPFARSGKSICLLFFNPSLRTRLSMQKAAYNLGIESFVFNLNSEGWQLEFGDGVVMNGNTSEHIIEAAGVMSSYFDAIAVRAFATLTHKQDDYQEKILSQFVKYCSVPVINMESATSHPLQSFADMITIEQFKKVAKPKVVLSWAPHPKALPQAVANSFLHWSNRMDYELVLTHPKGYELDPAIVGNARVEYDQNKAFSGADFIYAKNWSAFNDEVYGQVVSKDESWTITPEKMALTNQAKFMHCLPIRRNVIAMDAVLDGPDSIVITQAGHRITSAQMVLKQLLNIK
ncbi:N-acetylornithine carbamoyltransferase [Reichenbachiella agarivorans]|uniref:N-succinylornithine carbamoyltransferase n=1 Tax=Reichenbachiella agarivorans TaxID=2979464 RepID=A0ABY6CMN7_9BACT|nr:N-acetylornithine carbamoyltransferase [Reichenbachiella agarivorans]UXP31330.1 N-acetylornithine carbamoyltransferase [Reichenbachiella agarivorans]